MFLFVILFCFLAPLEIYHCSQLALLDSNNPKYYGLMNPEDYRIRQDHFTKSSTVNFDSNALKPKKEEELFYVIDDNVFIYILTFLDDFRFLNKLIFSSKRLFSIVSKHIIYRCSEFNPQIFWILPSSLRLYFGLRFLRIFEKEFQGIKGNVNLTRDELCGLILLALHIENPFYISKSDLKYVRACNPNYFITDDPKNSPLHFLPFPTAGIWKTMLLSRYIIKDSFFCIEAACTADPSKINWVIELITHKIGLIEKKENISISDSMKFLLYQLIALAPDFSSTLSHLLIKSVMHETISTFAAFLPLWTDPINQLIPPEQRVHSVTGEDHIIYRLAYANLSCRELLARTDLTEENLAVSLQLSRNVGNWKMATDLITKFPSNSFSFFFDPIHIDILRHMIINPTDVIDLHLSVQSQLNLALLIASIHFPQPQIINLFNRIIANQNNLPKWFLKELKCKRTDMFYNLAVNQRLNFFENCIVS